MNSSKLNEPLGSNQCWRIQFILPGSEDIFQISAKVTVQLGKVKAGCRLKTAQNDRQVGNNFQWSSGRTQIRRPNKDPAAERRSSGRTQIQHVLVLQGQASYNQQYRVEFAALPRSPLS